MPLSRPAIHFIPFAPSSDRVQAILLMLACVATLSNSHTVVRETKTRALVGARSNADHQGEADLMITVDVFHAAYEDAPVHVATLTSDQPLEQALEEAFTGTQNVESSWVRSRGQRGVSLTPTQAVLDRNDCRSTAMGDYVRVVDAASVGSFFRCCALGWKLIANREDLSRVGEAAIFGAI